MNIMNLGQNLSTINVQKSQILPPKPDSSAVTSDEKTSAPQKTINLRNISLEEMNQLIRSGVDGGLLDRIPVKKIILDGNGGYGGGYLPNEKFDLISSLEQSIEFKKSIHQPTDVDEKTLAKYLQLNGTPYPQKLDTSA